jgi:hypothetical protein
MNLSMSMEQLITGTVSPEEYRGRIISPYCSYLKDISVNEVRLRERTAALEGSYRSEESMSLKSSTNESLNFSISNPDADGIYTIGFYENWPVKLSARKEVEYSGKEINEREFEGSNQDFIGTNFLYNKELSKDINIDIRSDRMNATVLATRDRIVDTYRESTRDLQVNLTAHTTGIANIVYQQSESKYLDGPLHGYEIVNAGDESYYGDYNIAKSIRMSSRFDRFSYSESWLPCCTGGWADMIKADKKGHSAEEIFNCLCYSPPSKAQFPM